jgi:hypothetical protein
VIRRNRYGWPRVSRQRGGRRRDREETIVGRVGKVAARRGQVDAEARADAAAHMRRAARSLRAFDVDTFTLDPDSPRISRDPEPGGEGDRAVVAAGALVTGCTSLIDELSEAIAGLLSTQSATLRDLGADEWSAVGRLPEAYARHYTVAFVRKLLVATVSVTGRLAEPDWIPIACLAEQLALYLVVEEAASLLARYGLDDEPRDRYHFFEEQAFETDAHLRLYDGPAPGAELAAPAEPINAWFTPFYDGFYVHPYVEPRL